MNFIPKNPKKFQGNQVIINSDRLVFNAKREAILLYSARAIGFSTKGNFHFDTKDLPDNKFIINAPNIYLGIGDQKTGNLPTEPAVLGKQLEDLLIELLDFLEILLVDICYNISGISTTPGTPTGMNPANGTILNIKMQEIQNIKNNIKSIMSQNTKLI